MNTRLSSGVVFFSRIWLVIILLALPATTRATAITWSGSVNTTWDASTANWTGDSTTFTDDGTVDVTFNNTAGGTITISVDMTPLSTTVSAASGTYTFSGGPIDGAGAITKSGAGTLVLSSANTYIGGTTLSAGTLNLGNNAAIGTGTLTINGGTLTGMSGFNLGSGNNNAILVNENFKIQTAGSTTFNTGTGPFRISKALAVTLQGNSGSQPITIGNVITDASDGNTLNALDVTWSCSGDFSAGILSGAITLRGNQTLTVPAYTGQSSFTVSGAIGDASNNFGLTLAGTTRAYLTGASTYTGTTTINSGATLRLGSAGATGSLSASSAIVNNGALQFYRNNTITQGSGFGVISGTGSVGLLSGTTVLNAANTYSGSTTTPMDAAVTLLIGSSSIGSVGSITSGPVGTGTLAIVGSANNTMTTTVSSDSTTARTILNPVTLSRYILNLGDATKNGKLTFEGPLTLNTDYTLDVRSEVTFAGIVSGEGRSLVKAGAGTMNLDGATTVGSLRVGHKTGASGTLTVGSSGSLSVGSGSASILYVGVTESTGVLDVSAATSFTVNAGLVWIGESEVVNSNNGIGTLKLGINNTITAATYMEIGGNYNMGGNQVNCLGTVTTVGNGTTTIHTPKMYLGWAKTNQGTFTLNVGGTLANAATLTIDGVGVAADNRAQLLLGYQQNNGDNRRAIGTMDLSRGVARLTLSSLVLGQNSSSYKAGTDGTGALTLSASSTNVLDISGASKPVIIGQSTGGGVATGTLTIGDLDSSSIITATDNGTAIVIGEGAIINSTGTLNLNGGTLTITTTGSAMAGGGGTANLVLGNSTGNGSGMILKAGTNSTAWITGLTSAKIKTTGVTFDSNGYSITIPQALLADTVDAGGGLAKVGAGTLELSGTNTYTGATTVSNGTLLVSGTITSAVTVVSGGAIGGTGTISNSVTLKSGGQAVFTPGSPLTIIGSLALEGSNVVHVNLTGLESMGTLYTLATYTDRTGSFAGEAVVDSGVYSGVPIIVADNGTLYLKLVQQGTLLTIE